MKVAIPTEDKVKISGHFGRTRGFMIYEIENNKIISSEYRENNFTGHAMGMHHEHDHEHNNDHHQHTHGRILSALHDCSAVIAGGMGRKLLDDFNNANINVFVTSDGLIESAIHSYLENTLDHNDSKCCEH